MLGISPFMKNILTLLGEFSFRIKEKPNDLNEIEFDIILFVIYFACIVEIIACTIVGYLGKIFYQPFSHPQYLLIYITHTTQ